MGRRSIALIGLATIAMALIAATIGGLRRGPGEPPLRAGQPACPAAVAVGAGTVATESGAIRGTAAGDVLAFKGIPYAAPPVGDLRFRPPVPFGCWEGVREAAGFGSACPQFDDSDTLIGNEDCLTLNVWTAGATGPSRPVMVFIHGGGNVQGDSARLIYDGEHLARKGGVVVVTLNYRLGALGFLAHPALGAESDHGISGNYGILDQIAALRWVQRNIDAFGGDPARVMIFGESAGAVDVCVLVASPLAAGLFNRALMQSGSCNQPPPAVAEQTGMQVAEAIGCSGAAEVTACLRDADVAMIAAARRVRIAVGSLGSAAFGPHVDGHVLAASPLEVIRRGEHNRVPFGIGANADETAGLRPPPIPDEAAYQAEVTRLLGAPAAARVLAQYPASAYGSPRQAFIAATSDAAFVCPARNIARAAAEGQAEPVYRYFFTHAMDRGAARALGAFHGLELAFVFDTLGTSGRYQPTATELALADAMVGYWSRFAATGDPNQAGAVTWPRYDPLTDPYLRLDTPISAPTGVRTAECDFWARLAPPGLGTP